MKSQDMARLIVIGVVAGIISLLVASSVFNSSASRSTKVQVVAPINTIFPDVKNDPTYNAFFNPSALDATQPIQIGGPGNTAPFNP